MNLGGEGAIDRALAARPARVSESEIADPVSAYEAEFARLLNSSSAVAFGYARHALTAVFRAAGLRPGDGVVLSPLTCKVVPLALISQGLRPIYADVSEDTLNIDPERCESASGGSARAILFQHTYGNRGGVAESAEVAARKGLRFFEDCAQSLPWGGEGERTASSWGLASVFSNNLRKPLPAGSGGLAVTNDPGLAVEARKIRDTLARRGGVAEVLLRVEMWAHNNMLGPETYWPLFELNKMLDGSYRARALELEVTSEIDATAFSISPHQAREGLRWLESIESEARHRDRCCEDYRAELGSCDGIELPAAASARRLYCFPVFLENKNEVLRAARRGLIELIAWPISAPIYPIEEIESLKSYGYQPGSCPTAERVARKLVGLPTHRKVTSKHRSRIVELLRGGRG